MENQQWQVADALKNGGVESWSMQMMGQIFGPLVGAGPTLFSLAIGYFNIAILGVGGLLFFYNVTAGLLQTAHEGQVLGKHWNSLWAPIRLIFAVGLMMPMPNLGGYNTVQAGVAYVVRGSTALASLVWAKAVPALLDGEAQIVAMTPTIPTQFLREAWNMSACMSLANYQLDAAGSSARVTVTKVENDDEAVAFVSALGAKGETAGICGSFSTPAPPAHLAEAARGIFKAAHTDAIIKLLSTTDILTQRALRSSLSRDGQPLTMADELRAGLIAANQALLPVAELVKESSSGEGQQQLRDYISNDSGQGWLSAGSYYLVLARLNQEASSVLSASPTVLTPARYIFETTGATLDAAASGRWATWFGNASAANLPLNQEEVQRIGTDMERTFARASAALSSFGFALPDPALAAALSARQGEGGSIWDVLSAAVDDVGRQLAQQVALYFAPDAQGADPLVGLVALGQFLVGAAASLLAALAVASAVPILGAGVGTAMAVIGPLVLAMTVAGGAMSVLLPAMPFLLWVLAVFGYFLAVVGAIVGTPLWALAHFRLDGEGIAPDSAKHGYLLLLRLALTPILMIVGFFAAMSVFRAVSGLIGVGIYYLLSSFSGHPFFWLISVVVMTFLTVAIFLIVIERSFSLVTSLPNVALAWIGGGSSNDDN